LEILSLPHSRIEFAGSEMVEVSLECAIVGRPGTFDVTIEDGRKVSVLKKEIKKEKMYQFPADQLQLFLAKKKTGDVDEWLQGTELAAVALDEARKVPGMLDERKKRQNFVWMDPTLYVNNDKHFGKEFTPGEGQVHVLVVVPQDTDEQPASKKAKLYEDQSLIAVADGLDIDAWRIGHIALNIRNIETDFPEWFYVRKETLDIIKIFHANMEKGLHTVFMGTPGVGKSMLVVSFAFFMACYQQKRVVLLRKVKNEGFFMLYLDVERKQYWRKEKAEITDLDLVENRDFELCLDGFLQADIEEHFGRLTGFRLLATSAQYSMKNDDTLLRQCLVPFWSSSDLNIIGARRGWTDHDIKERYYYSGGNLRDFLSDKIVAMDSIDKAIRKVDLEVATLLSTQYALGSKKQIDRLRMTSIRPGPENLGSLAKYGMVRSWFCVITSEYALRQLGKIVEPTYYEELWSKGHMLGDDGLMGIAFENFVHAMARDGKTMELQVRPYDRLKQKQHTYSAVEFTAKSYRNEGINAAECGILMRQLSGVDYWYPVDRCLVTIDSVAKLNMSGQQGVVGLIQITKSDNHKIDPEALDRYADLFPGGAEYVALVPDKETSDKFRLSPADPPTQVPLHVAYIATWNI